MAQELESYTRLSRPGPEDVYPWGVWLSGKSILKLVAGEDYNCTTLTMVTMIRRRAAKQGLKVTLYTEKKPKSAVIIAAVKPIQKSPTRKAVQ